MEFDDIVRKSGPVLDAMLGLDIDPVDIPDVLAISAAVSMAADAELRELCLHAMLVRHVGQLLTMARMLADAKAPKKGFMASPDREPPSKAVDL